MTSVLRALFCCLGKRVNDSKIPDERTRFINPLDVEAQASIVETAEISVRDAFDRGGFDDRLQSIVQSKEGNMVNVNSPLPFNLYNKPAAVLDALAHHNNNGHFFTSASRSASVSTAYANRSPNYHHPKAHRPPPLHLHSSLGISPFTPNSATFPRSRSRSTTLSGSLPRSTSPLESSGGEAGQPDMQSLRVGVLGVKLVRHAASKRAGEATAATVESRGRTMLKKGVEELTPHATPSLIAIEADFVGPDNQPVDTGEVVIHGQDISMDSTQGVPGTDSPQRRLSHSSHQPNPLDFLIQDVGSICASWED